MSFVRSLQWVRRCKTRELCETRAVYLLSVRSTWSLQGMTSLGV